MNELIIYLTCTQQAVGPEVYVFKRGAVSFGYDAREATEYETGCVKVEIVTRSFEEQE